jgi:hypothetical protein
MQSFSHRDTAVDQCLIGKRLGIEPSTSSASSPISHVAGSAPSTYTSTGAAANQVDVVTSLPAVIRDATPGSSRHRCPSRRLVVHRRPSLGRQGRVGALPYPTVHVAAVLRASPLAMSLVPLRPQRLAWPLINLNLVRIMPPSVLSYRSMPCRHHLLGQLPRLNKSAAASWPSHQRPHDPSPSSWPRASCPPVGAPSQAPPTLLSWISPSPDPLAQSGAPRPASGAVPGWS